MKDFYTKEEVLKIIEEAYHDGVNAGQVEYGTEGFVASDYLEDTPTNQNKGV